MIQLTIKNIIDCTDGRLLNEKGDKNLRVQGFSTDTRTLLAGQLFIALKGINYNGSEYVEEAFNKGACGAVVTKNSVKSIKEQFKNIIEVNETEYAMGRIASHIRRIAETPAVCITGTNGKTTVKEILSHLLSAKYKVLKSKKSYNNIIGMSLTLFDLDSSYDVVVLELGTNHPGEISRLSKIAEPHMAIITNISDGHLSSFVDRKGVYFEKINLLDFLPENGMAFLNKDDSFLARVSIRGVLKKYYGFSGGSDYFIHKIAKKGKGFRFFINDREYYLPLEGSHNIYNAAGAIAVAGYFGLSYEEVRERLKTVKLPDMRIEKITMDNVTFINDAYNSNPGSFECALRVLVESDLKGKKGVVAGDMLELGKRSDEFHRLVGRSIASKKIDFLITLGEKAGLIAQGAVDSGMGADCVVSVDSHAAAAEIIKDKSWPSSVVLLKGSRGTRMEEVLKCFTTSYTI